MVLFLIGLAYMLTACALTGGKNYGYFEYDEEAKKIFEVYEVLSDHNYFYSGPEARPNAIIALQQEYTLQSKLWKPVDMTSQRMKKWLTYDGHDPAKFKAHIRSGRYMYARNGTRIGLWYSLKDWNTHSMIKMVDVEQKIVVIATPSVFMKKTRLLHEK
jgi:hypothetical protein